MTDGGKPNTSVWNFCIRKSGPSFIHFENFQDRSGYLVLDETRKW